MPEFYNYVRLSQGYQRYAVQEEKTRRESFNVSDIRTTGATERMNFTANVTDFRWLIKNVPALKEENYTSTLQNHISKIEFQLASTRDPLVQRQYMQNWPSVSKQLLESESFGLQITKDNGWLNGCS